MHALRRRALLAREAARRRRVAHIRFRQKQRQTFLTATLSKYAMDFAEPPKAYEEAAFFELIAGVYSSSAARKTICHLLVCLLRLLQLLPTLLCVALVALSRQFICNLVKNCPAPYCAQ